jgi:hypothetical protein
MENPHLGVSFFFFSFFFLALSKPNGPS